mgnify:CR=1 FL=1
MGANIEEAIGGYSKKKFRAKMSISNKEIRETKYWLRLLKETDFVSTNQLNYKSIPKYENAMLVMLPQLIVLERENLHTPT